MGRRPKGEGGITQRQDGRWQGTLYVDGPGGKKLRKYVYGKTPREVSEKLRTAREAKEAGLRFDADKITVEKYLLLWVTDYIKGTVKHSTWKRYEQLVRVHLVPELGTLRLSKLTAAHVQSLYSRKLGSGLSPRTVEYIHRTLRKALKEAMGFDLVRRNVTEHVKPPSVQQKEMMCLSLEQVTKLLEQAEGDPLEALYVLALETGLRQGELLGLRWQDVDFERGVIYVRQQLSWRSGEHYRFETLKNFGSERPVAMTSGCVRALRIRRRLQLEHKVRCRQAWNEHDLVFCTQIGTPIHHRNLVRRSFKPLLERAELPSIRFHDLRHTSATLLLAKGVYLGTVLLATLRN